MRAFICSRSTFLTSPLWPPTPVTTHKFFITTLNAHTLAATVLFTANKDTASKICVILASLFDLAFFRIGLIWLLHICQNLSSLKSHLLFVHIWLRLAVWLVQHLILHSRLHQLGLLFEHVHNHRHVRLLCTMRGPLGHGLRLVHHHHVHLCGDLRSLRSIDVYWHLGLAWSHADGLGRLCSNNLSHSYVVLPSCWFTHLNVLRHDTLTDWCLHLNLVR